jgi:hypothetical protein
MGGFSLVLAAKRQKQEVRFASDISLELYGWDPQGVSGHYDLRVNHPALGSWTYASTFHRRARPPKVERAPAPDDRVAVGDRRCRDKSETASLRWRSWSARRMLATGAELQRPERRCLRCCGGRRRDLAADALARSASSPSRISASRAWTPTASGARAATGGDPRGGQGADEIEAIARALLESDAGSVLVTRADAARRAALRGPRRTPRRTRGRGSRGWRRTCRSRAGW